MIVLDLEWSHSYDKTNLDEILQIGAVKVDRLGGPSWTPSTVPELTPEVLRRFDRAAESAPMVCKGATSQEKPRRWRTCGKKAVRAAGA